MTSNTIKRFLDEQEAIHRQLTPLSTVMEAMDDSSGILQLIEDANRNDNLMRAVFGPMEDLKQAAFLHPASYAADEAQRISALIAETEKRFSLPEIAEATSLLSKFEDSRVANALNHYQDQASLFQNAIENMRVPWLDVEDNIRSISGLVELQTIGQALRTMPTFDTRLEDMLRTELGDWREKIIWPTDIFTDPLARTSFYSDLGLNSSLTAFPSEAFEQSIDIAGLKEAPIRLEPAYNFESEPEPDEVAYERTNTAHDRLQRFETQIRKFIDEQMKAIFGENWIKQQVPGEIRKAWLEKQQKVKDSGGPEWPLIAYADFSDYVPIITRRDNWNRVFKPIFRRQASIQESFQRLYPIRICTMHARLITQDDELYLYVETKRILTAIGIAI